MAKYLVEARYTAEGTKGLAREGGTGRRAAAAKAIEGLGGKLETFYYAFGDVDAYVIFDAPDVTRCPPPQHKPENGRADDAGRNGPSRQEGG